jgi:hypothetical protein
LNRTRLVYLFLAVVALAVGWKGRPRGEPLGDAAELDWSLDPVQRESSRAPFEIPTRKGPATLTPRAEYEIVAVVEGSERYFFDASAFVSPVDLLLTWGELPTPAWRDRLDYSQSWRFFFWRSEDRTLDASYVIAHSANTHVIPANPNVRRALLALDRGDAVRLRGLLVDVRAPGFLWPTSIVRTDHGDQGCEILYVESVERAGRIYR